MKPSFFLKPSFLLFDVACYIDDYMSSEPTTYPTLSPTFLPTISNICGWNNDDNDILFTAKYQQLGSFAFTWLSRLETIINNTKSYSLLSVGTSSIATVPFNNTATDSQCISRHNCYSYGIMWNSGFESNNQTNYWLYLENQSPFTQGTFLHSSSGTTLIDFCVDDILLPEPTDYPTQPSVLPSSTPTLQPTSNPTFPYVAIGAYKDNPDRNMRYGPGSTGGHFTNDTCFLACENDYKYFGVQNGGECFCDNDFNRSTRDGVDNCGYSGGPWCNFIYMSYSQPTSSPTYFCDSKYAEIMFTSMIKMDDWSIKYGNTLWKLSDNFGNVYYNDSSLLYKRNEIVTSNVCLYYNDIDCYAFEIIKNLQDDGLKGNINAETDYWLYLDPFGFNNSILIASDTWNNNSYLKIDFCISMLLHWISVL